MKLNFQKNQLVSGKSTFFVTDLSCTLYPLCLKIGIWQVGSLWKCCVFNNSTFK